MQNFLTYILHSGPSSQISNEDVVDTPDIAPAAEPETIMEFSKAAKMMASPIRISSLQEQVLIEDETTIPTATTVELKTRSL